MRFARAARFLTLISVRVHVKAGWTIDPDALLDFAPGDELFWTAPIWLTEGDVLFFYQTRNAAVRTTKLLRQARAEFPRPRKLIALLERAKESADKYANSVFACALVSGASRRLEAPDKHFVSKIFAPLARVHIFDQPLRRDCFTSDVRIGRSTITPLYKREFDFLKRRLSENNELPDFLQNAVSGGNSFQNANARNWAAVSCRPEAKFIHEAQLRVYLLDFFLGDIKDKRTPLLEECECRRAGKKTGRADYFVKIHGLWLPVEAKLDLPIENAAFAQATKYTGIDSFAPTVGKFSNKTFRAGATPLCLIFDRKGLYFVQSNGAFLNCAAKIPFMKREHFDKSAAQDVRSALKVLLGESRLR